MNTISFEIFPPKRDMALDPVKETVKELATLKPSAISVTYGAAGGSSSVNTSAMASFIQNECGVPAVAHLTCVNSTHHTVMSELQKLRALGVKRILALRGDRVEGEAPGEFEHAIELVRIIRAFGGFSIGGACYPEGHPESEHLKDDIERIREKADAGLDFLVSQMIFDNPTFYAYLSRLQGAGVHIPVIPGIMPVVNAKSIRRICALSGTQLPPRFKAIVDRFGEDERSMRSAGISFATEQIIDLYANGIKGVHLYTMNKPEVARAIMENLKGIVETA